VRVLLVLLAFCAVLGMGEVRAEAHNPRHMHQTFENDLYDEDHLFREKTRNDYRDIHAALDPQTQKQRRLEKQKRLEQSSRLEKLYANRLLDEPAQFGYDLFGNLSARMDLDEKDFTPSGAVQDDYILGSGDKIDIVFSGQRNDRKTYTVDTQGMVLINEFQPITAAGRSLGIVRQEIEDMAARTPNTNVYVSLSAVRQISVLIVGHVKKPGRQNLSVFHTVLDALMNAGGIKKTGSLRQIKLVRSGRSMIVDIYGLLLHGATNMDLNLRDGDRIVVPAIGPTVAISGEVKRAGIYEILPDLRGMFNKAKQRSELLTLNDMLNLVGGVLTPGKTRFLKLDITDDGQEVLQDIDDPFVPEFGDGSILVVSKGEDKRSESIELTGHTRRPGLYALRDTPSLSALIGSTDVLGDDIYPLIGVIQRWNDDQLAHEMIDFPVRLVMNGEYDRKLQDSDTVHLFSNEQIANLDAAEDEIEEGSFVEEDEDRPPPYIFDDDMRDFLKERSVYVRGGVRNSGLYPVAQGVTLDSVLAVSGGLSIEANSSHIEITSNQSGAGNQTDGRSGTRRTRVNLREDNPADIALAPGDGVRVNEKFSKVKAGNSVLIVGEVESPGRYDLLPGDTLSDLLERAGSMTPQAYPEGAIFSRESERRAEETRFKAQARDIKRAIALALDADDEKIDTAKIVEARALAAELEEAQGLGRITVEADLGALKAQPELDMLLEAGDRVYIPKRALNVRVRGEVLSEAALQFREQKAPLDYINEAGGFTFHADKDRTFVLYPDGSAQPLQVSPWNHKAVFIPPGSTIVVPRDPKPFDFVESAKDVSQILSNLAITAIFIDDVRDD
jgi:polysaccharide export outer membrane protein